eukprot:3731037-Pleurochrysis_carterae.AAC.1
MKKLGTRAYDNQESKGRMTIRSPKGERATSWANGRASEQVSDQESGKAGELEGAEGRERAW